jgi:hypothetical protein
MKTMKSIACVKRLAFGSSLAAMWVALLPAASYGDESLPKGHYTLTGAKVTPIDKTERGDVKSERLTHGIRFDIQTTYVLVKGTEAEPFEILNPTVESKSSLTLDKPVTFKGENVPAGTNLLNYKKFDGSFMNVHMPDLFPFAIHSATIMKDFKLPADHYVVTFKWTTKQGGIISDTAKVYIDVDLAGKK